MVTLQFSTERAIDSALIRFFTWSAISHVDIVLHDGRLLGARIKGGVQIRPNNYDQFSKRIIAGVNVPSTPVIGLALSQVGKPYDWKGILNFGLHRDWRDDSAWFCSELVAWAFEQAGYPLLNPEQSYSRITPRDLLLSPYVVTPEYPHCTGCGKKHA